MEQAPRPRHRQPELVNLAIMDLVHWHCVQGDQVAEERLWCTDEATAKLRAEARHMGAHTLMVVELVVGDVAPAAIMVALDCQGRDEGVQ